MNSFKINQIVRKLFIIKSYAGGKKFHQMKLFYFLTIAFLYFIGNCLSSSISSGNNDNRSNNNNDNEFYASSNIRPKSKLKSSTQQFIPTCPLCGIDSSNLRKEKPLHKIVECFEFTNNFHLNSNNNKTLPSYKCKCKYMRLNEKTCSLFSKSYNKLKNRNLIHKIENEFVGIKSTDLHTSSESDNLYQLTSKHTTSPSECLIVHVGMAVKGHNLMYKQWVNKEHCFNLCINTTVKNGFAFDCKSFEHWHSDCVTATQSTSDVDKDSNTCATFSNDQMINVHHLKKTETASKRPKRASKIDYCVLSNQTMQSAGKNFAENSAVTYYELLCKRNAIETSNTRHKESTTYLTTTIPATTPKPTTLSTHRVTFKLINDRLNQESSSTKKFSTKILVWNISSVTSVSSQITSNLNRSAPKLPMRVTNKKKDESGVETNIDLSQIPTQDQLSKFKKQKSSKATSSPSPDALAKPSKKCKFNPCQNDGTCFLIEVDRFTCICKDFYYGVYCEHSIIYKTCYRKHMELVINYELASQLKVKLSGLYINDRDNTVNCRLKPFNDTFGIFHLPYDKCLTIESSNKFEKIYTNKLFSSPENSYEDVESDSGSYLATFDCRIDKIDLEYSNLNAAYDQTKSNQEETKTDKSKVPCIIDLLNIKLKMFQDDYYGREILSESEAFQPNKEYSTDLYQPIFVQLSVEYSQKLDQLYQLKDKLQYFHLTIERCWLTRTQNENLNILQVLIENGCPKENVRFYDTTFTKNSIRFSFNLLNKDIKQRINQAYLHCFPEICTDAPKILKDTTFYYQYKSCQNISTDCSANKNVERKEETTIFLDENNERSYDVMETRDVYSIKSFVKPSQCNNKFSKGPIYINQNHTNSPTLQQNSKYYQKPQIKSFNTATRRSVQFNFLTICVNMFEFFFLFVLF